MWLSWLVCQPVKRKVAGLIPGQSTYSGFRFNPPTRWPSMEGNRSMFLSLSPFFSLSKKKIFLVGVIMLKTVNNLNFDIEGFILIVAYCQLKAVSQKIKK